MTIPGPSSHEAGAPHRPVARPKASLEGGLPDSGSLPPPADTGPSRPHTGRFVASAALWATGALWAVAGLLGALAGVTLVALGAFESGLPRLVWSGAFGALGVALVAAGLVEVAQRRVHVAGTALLAAAGAFALGHFLVYGGTAVLLVGVCAFALCLRSGGVAVPAWVAAAAAWTGALAALALRMGWRVWQGSRWPPEVLRDIEQELWNYAYWDPNAVGPAMLGVGALLLVGAWGLAAGWGLARRLVALLLVILDVLWLRWGWNTRASATDAGSWLPAAFLFTTTVVALLLLFDRRSRDHFAVARFSTTASGRAVAAVRAPVLRFAEAVPLRWVTLGLIAIGVALRIAAPFFMEFRADGQTYTAMGRGWAETGGFLMPFGDVTTSAPSEPAYSHHYPPAYPFLLGLAYKGFGWGIVQTQVTGVLVSLAALAAVYFTTRDLYGTDKALWVTGILGLEPHFIWAVGTNFSENLVLLCFALTMWGILKSLDRPTMVIVAGAAAGLAYLSRSSIGAFFLIAGAAGFLWRFLYMRWQVFGNLPYLGAVAVFGSMVFAWAWRNVGLFGAPGSDASYFRRGFDGWPAWDAPFMGAASASRMLDRLFGDPGTYLAGLGVAAVAALVFYMGRPRPVHVPGAARMQMPAYLAIAAGAILAGLMFVAWLSANLQAHGAPPWETSSYTTFVQGHAADHPDLWLKALLYKAPFFAVFLMVYMVWFRPQIGASLRRIRDEHESALWLSVGLLFLISWIITSMFWTFEQSPMFWMDNHRYILIAYLPILWIVVRHARLGEGGFRLRSAALATVLLLLVTLVFLSPVRFPENSAAAALEGRLEGGEQVAVQGNLNKYSIYTYLPRHDVYVFILQKDDVTSRPDWVVTNDINIRPPGYEIVHDSQVHYWDGNTHHAYLLRRTA